VIGGLKRLTATLSEPRNLIALLITAVLAMAEWQYGVVGGYEKLALTLGTAVACEIALSLYLVGRFPALQSAYISGISLTILLRPQAGIVWPFVVGALLAIGSKYVLRAWGRHLWNPSNFAIAALLLLAPGRVAILSHEFGNDLAANAVIWVFGILVASRARILHVSATYVACFLALAWGRTLLTGAPFVTEIAPLTGPMYQLMIFFMLTDPRTSVGTRKGRMVTVACIALLEALIRLGNDVHAPGAALLAPAPAILALFFVGPAALALDLARRARAAAAPASHPHTGHTVSVASDGEPVLVTSQETLECSRSRSTAPVR
jgi:Na+-transporting NADH:ubiquinone oxidoreductase subunit NqrB